MQTGRPSLYTAELAAFICERISFGESVRKICDDPDMPAASSIFKWLIEHKEFSEQYARAREAQMDAMVEEIIHIADDTSNDTIETEKGSYANNEWINRSRVRIDTRKWLMSKLAPKKYGDKLDIEHSGAIDLAGRLAKARKRTE
jgi:hypothetical protein